jgi:hypothetical protein
MLFVIPAPVKAIGTDTLLFDDFRPRREGLITNQYAFDCAQARRTTM